MKSFLDDFKYAWNKPNNGLIRLILINVLFCALINLVWLFTKLGEYPGIYESIIVNIKISSVFQEFIFKPWTLITYFFGHEEIFPHLIFNMLFLYWFGMIFTEYLGSKKLVSLYILGGLAGGIAYLLIYNLIPPFNERNSIMIGASASVYAIVVGAATLAPEYRMHLLFFGPVKIKYIALVYIFLSFIGVGGGNAGGNIAHLGGALIGFLFVRQLGKGDDWSKPVVKVLDSFSEAVKPKPKMKVTHKKSSGKGGGYNSKMGSTIKNEVPNQKIVDAILDKISESGYDKLTTEEKNILFKASQKKS